MKEMKRSKSNELRDRLSELPDCLILEILSLLPMRDVVRTTILSKSWNGLWTTVRSLIFDAKTNSPAAFRNFVNRAMLNWKGTKLQKLGVNFNSNRGFYCRVDVDTWLQIAIEKGVEELSLDLKRVNRDFYSLPQSLYSCSTIRTASLLHCNLDIKGDVQWSRLTSLRIEVRWLSEGAIEKVLNGAPLMEILILSFADVSGVLNINSKSLKRLKIERNMIGGVYNPRISSVRICTPNVKTLEISGIPYCEYVLVNACSLTSAKVGFPPGLNVGFSPVGANIVYDPHGAKVGFYTHSTELGYNPQYREYVVYKPISVGYYTGNSDLLKGLLEHFFPNICRLEKLTLSCWFVKVLRKIKKENKHMVAPLLDVKFLALYATCVDDVLDILDIFPAVTTLVMLQETGTPKYPHFFEIVCSSREACISEFEAEKSLEPNSDFLMPHVRAVEITWADHDNSIFSFIETLSRNVRKLEKMVLRLTDTESGATRQEQTRCNKSVLVTGRTEAVQKLFPAAEVFFCQD